MNRIFLLVACGISLLSGCLIAPVPLVETNRRSMWDGADGSSKALSIVEEERTWYLPVLVSPEGPAKKRQQKSQCHYYFGSATASDEKPAWQKIEEIPWLTIEEDTAFFTWHKIARLEGTRFWVAFRRVSSDSGGTRGGTFEIAVFDRVSLVSKRVVASRTWPAVQIADREYLSDLGYDSKDQSIALDSSKGPRRYFLLDGSEKEPPEPTKSAPGSA